MKKLLKNRAVMAVLLTLLCAALGTVFMGILTFLGCLLLDLTGSHIIGAIPMIIVLMSIVWYVFYQTS